MPVTLYLDAHIPRSISLGLRVRQVDVLTAQEDKAAQLSDPELLDRATALGRTLFTFDQGFLAEAVRQQLGIPFDGLIYAHPLQVSIGACIHDLEIIAKAASLDELPTAFSFCHFNLVDSQPLAATPDCCTLLGPHPSELSYGFHR